VATLRHLVVLSLEDWDDVWRRNQYLVDGILREDPTVEVLFIEPAADPIHAMRSKRLPRPGRGMRVVPGYNGRLRTLQPTKLLPRRLGAVADAMLVSSVRSAVRRLGWVAPVLWINDPGWLPILESTGWPSLYDITDDWVQADRGEREHSRLAHADAELLRMCDQVVVCSPALSQSKGERRDVFLIRNAVDVARYREPFDRPSDLPKKPTALYAGTLHEDRLDLDLVLATADHLVQLGACLVLVGPNALSPANSAKLLAASGVLVLGSRPRDTIPAYLQHADVLVGPHIIDDFTDSLDPIKLYEYFAVGRPVVRTQVAGFREQANADNVVIASGGAFVAAVEAAVTRWQSSLVRRDIPDWSDRASDMYAVLEPLLASGGSNP
jgi:teichuronic acid biosynthesis glycosyltransferase TuaH